MGQRRLFLLLLAVVLFGLANRGASGRNKVSPNDPDVKLLAEAIARVQAQYVDELSTEEITSNAIRGMLSALDPYSVFLDEEDFTNLRIGTTGNYEGLGIQISIRDGFLTVIAPFEGTPAFRAGILAGDRIIQIDEESTESMTLNDAVDRMRGRRGTSVALKVARGRDHRVLDIDVTRDVIELKSVPYVFLDDRNIGYVRVSSFAENTGRDVRRAIGGLIEDGAVGLIVDLRGNPGGLLDQAVEVAECFVPSGKMIVETRGRHRREDRQYDSRSRRTYDLPLVVMIDQGSASASEIVSGAVQDWDLGLVLGNTSFGKASVQSVIGLSDGSALKLTTAKYYTPSGRLIQREERRDEPKVTSAIDNEGHEYEIDDAERFHTAGGRPIRAGGGISPDIDVERPEYSDLVYDLERLGLFRTYAVDMTERLNSWQASEPLPDGELERFKAHVIAGGELEFTDEAFGEAADYAALALRREAARRQAGDLAAWRIQLEADEQYLEAATLFDEARSLHELLELADGRAEAESSSP